METLKTYSLTSSTVYKPRNTFRLHPILDVSLCGFFPVSTDEFGNVVDLVRSLLIVVVPYLY